jgi:hypothetical protein
MFSFMLYLGKAPAAGAIDGAPAADGAAAASAAAVMSLVAALLRAACAVSVSAWELGLLPLGRRDRLLLASFGGSRIPWLFASDAARFMAITRPANFSLIHTYNMYWYGLRYQCCWHRSGFIR